MSCIYLFPRCCQSLCLSYFHLQILCYRFPAQHFSPAFFLAALNEPLNTCFDSSRSSCNIFYFRQRPTVYLIWWWHIMLKTVTHFRRKVKTCKSLVSCVYKPHPFSTIFLPSHMRNNGKNPQTMTHQEQCGQVSRRWIFLKIRLVSAKSLDPGWGWRQIGWKSTSFGTQPTM